jgi:hypothetical protein
MSASIERIIRPAQTAGIRPTNFAVARASPAAIEAAIITWGGAGATVFELKASIQISVKPVQAEETSRTYDVIKVKNPDDETQSIQTEVMTAYQARNQIDGSRIQLRYQPQQASKDVEVVSKGNVRKSGS